MHTVKRLLTTHAGARLTGWLLLMACVGACDRAPPQGASMVVATTAAPTSAPRPAARPATAAATAALDDDAVAARADREQTLRVQQHLREQRRARETAPSAHGNERCLGGQKMRRVANGWVQAGAC